MPDIQTEHAAGYVIGLLQEAGLMSSNGMGPVPLSWLEIESWQRCAAVEIPLWERLTIKTLSEEYVSELVQAKDRTRPPPFAQAQLEIDRQAVSDKILSIFSRRRKRQESSATQGEGIDT